MASSKYRVPEADRREYNRMIGRANSRIKYNLQYIQQEGITDRQTKRSLLGDYESPEAWNTSKAAFSSRIVFNSKREYEQYKRHVAQWGGVETGNKIGNKYEIETPAASVEGRKEGYYNAIIKSLTQSAIENGVELKDGKLPGNISEKLQKLNLEQISHFFDMDEPVADLEYLPYSEVDFNGVNGDEFVEKVDAIISNLKQVYNTDRGKRAMNENQRRYYTMIKEGIDARNALKQIFPKATEHQIRYYKYSGNLPAAYKPPKPRKPRKKKK